MSVLTGAVIGTESEVDTLCRGVACRRSVMSDTQSVTMVECSSMTHVVASQSFSQLVGWLGGVTNRIISYLLDQSVSQSVNRLVD